jgi:hypothetical protein
MVIFSINIGRVEITPERYPAFLASLRLGFAIFAFLCLVGLFASLIGAKAKIQADNV